MKKPSLQKGKDETQDTFYHGQILVNQKKEGYRFAVDAPLLADFIHTEASDRCLELGTGCGIISLLLSIKSFSQITAVEIQQPLADLARRNVRRNRLEKRIRVVHADFLEFRPARRYDVVFSNPPYIKAHGGRLSTIPEKLIAKHEVKCDILGIMQKTAALLKKTGRAYFVFAAKRNEELMEAVEKAGLCVAAIRMVHSRKGLPPNFLLARCVFPPSSKRRLPPLFLFEESGDYSLEAKEIFAGRIHAPTF